MILDAIIARRLARRGTTLPPAVERGRRRPFGEALTGMVRRPAPICEFKRRSPSAGVLREGDVIPVARAYERHGAAALSILTNVDDFGAEPGDLFAARSATQLPVLRKDFLVDEFDIEASLAMGADAILLIARLFTEARLRHLVAHAAAHDLEVLVETHNLTEAGWAIGANARIIGVNHRDLDTLAMDLSLSEQLRAYYDSSTNTFGLIWVAESGLRTAAEVAHVAATHFDAVLIGESLLRAPDPGVALSEIYSESARPEPAGPGAQRP